MPYSLISKPAKLSELFQDAKTKKKNKPHEPRKVFGTKVVFFSTIFVCTLVLSILAGSQFTTTDIADVEKSESADQVSIRMGEGVQLAQLNTDGEIVSNNPATFKADLTLVTTPDTTKVCEGACTTSTELQLFNEARVYIKENSTFQINRLDFDNNEAEFSVENGRIWVRAPRDGQIKFNIYPYSVVLSDRAVMDMEIVDSQITFNQISRFANVVNTENQSVLQLTARQTATVERDEKTNVSNISPRIFQDITLDGWHIGRMAEERVWLKSQEDEYAEIEFSTAEVNGFLKEWFSFLIISDEERASAKFANLDALINEALTDSQTLSTSMREFKAEAAEAAKSSDNTVEDYLMSRWEKLRYITPYTRETAKTQSAEYQVKTKIEETYASVSGDYDHFQWERVYSFEDLLGNFDTTSALAVLEQYYVNLLKNISKYETADLNAQLLYLENLFSANTVYIYEDFWNTLFEIEYTVLSQLKPAEANAFGTELIIEKIKQVGYLWLGTDKYNASLVAQTIMGEFVFTQDKQQIKYSFFRDNYDELVQNNEFVSVIFDENDSIIEKAMNYQSGKDDKETLTEDDIFAMEFYQEYVNYLENKPTYYQRPPTVQDVVNRLTELGLPVQASQLEPIPGWIEFSNQSNDRFDLTGWFVTEERLEKNPKHYELPAQIIEPHHYAVVDFAAKTLDLSPSGKIIYLYDADGNLQTSVNYPGVPKGLTYSFQTDGRYGWTQPTRGTANDRLILPKSDKVKKQDNIVISEIYPLDEYRFDISGINLGKYKFDAVYDYSLNVFSELSSDPETLKLIDKLAEVNSEYADKSKDQIYYDESIITSYFMPASLGSLITEVNPYQMEMDNLGLASVIPSGITTPYKFIAQTNVEKLKAGVNNIIAEIESEKVEEIYIAQNFTFQNFLALPSRLSNIASEMTYHASYEENTNLENSDSSSLQILQAIIRDQLLLHEIYLDNSSFANCDTETYKTCSVVNAWVINPEDEEKVYFSFDYDTDTKEATDISMKRQSYAVADTKKAVSLRQAVLVANQFLDQVEEVQALVAKELNAWSAKLNEGAIQYIDEKLQEFEIENAYVSFSGEKTYFSAVYNAADNTLRQIKFDDGKIFNKPLTKEQFETLTDTLYRQKD